MASIAYLVHDTGDAAVARRVRMFHAGGARVALAGFHRRSPPQSVSGAPVTDLGRTADAKLAARMVAVLRHLARPALARRHVAGADVIVARNLETLAIAVRAATKGQRIVYEALDIHRLLSARGMVGQAVRLAERLLLRRVALVLTSSPAFEARHFREAQHYAGPVRVEENRILALADDPAPTPASVREAGPVRRIGWFGMLRCRKSLAMLRTLVEQSAGTIEVSIAGIPAYTEFDDFDRDVAGLPGLAFVGRYGADDLSRLYGHVDFAWAIDYFEEGHNSAWLLPNRLYESLSFGAIPIALADVETGRWLVAQGVGLVVADPVAEIGATLATLSDEALARHAAAVAAVPRALLVADTAACAALTAAVTGSGG